MAMTTPDYNIKPEIVDSYKRALEFNNQLLLEQFDRRYQFQTDQHASRMRSSHFGRQPVNEEKIQEYIVNRSNNKEKRRMAYETKLTLNVGPSVQR